MYRRIRKIKQNQRIHKRIIFHHFICPQTNHCIRTILNDHSWYVPHKTNTWVEKTILTRTGIEPASSNNRLCKMKCPSGRFYCTPCAWRILFRICWQDFLFNEEPRFQVQLLSLIETGEISIKSSEKREHRSRIRKIIFHQHVTCTQPTSLLTPWSVRTQSDS